VAGISARPYAFFRLGPAEGGKAQCFAVRRGEIERRAIGAALYAPELRLFIDRLSKNPSASGLLRDYVDINPKIDAGGLEPDSPVSFVPMDAVEDGSTGGMNSAPKRLVEVQKGYTAFSEGDILWAKITPCMENGKSCIARGLINGIGFGSTEFHVLRSHDGRLSQSFLWEFLNQETLRKVARYAFTGSAGHQRVPDNFLADLPFPLLSSSEQERLVSRMDAARAKRRAKLAEADALLDGLDGFLLATLGLTSPPKDERKVFAARLSAIVGEGRFDPGFHHPQYTEMLRAFIASPFEKRRLGVISPDLVGGATPSKGSTELYAASGIKFFRILNVKANAFDLSDLNYIKDEVHQGELKRSQLQEDDVLMTITGRVGNAAVVTSDLLPANINQHIVRLRVTADDVNPQYLSVYLNSSVGLALSNRGVTGGTRIALDYGAIRAIRIPIPPPALQDDIVAEARRRRDEAQRLRAEAETGWEAAKRWFEEQLLGPAQP